MQEVQVQVTPSVQTVVTDTSSTDLIVNVQVNTQVESVSVDVQDAGLTVEVQPQIITLDVVVQSVDQSQDVLVQPSVNTEVVQVQVTESTGGSAAEDPDLNASKIFTYTSGVLTKIQFSTGHYKDFFYTSGLLTRVDYVKTTETIRSDFTYDSSSNLTQVLKTVI